MKRKAWKKIFVLILPAAVNLTLNILGIKLKDFPVPMWFIGFCWGVILTGAVWTFWPDILSLLGIERGNEKGYEVLTYWNEPDDSLQATIARIGGKKYFPKTIFEKRTGKIREISYPSSKKR